MTLVARQKDHRNLSLLGVHGGLLDEGKLVLVDVDPLVIEPDKDVVDHVDDEPRRLLIAQVARESVNHLLRLGFELPRTLARVALRTGEVTRGLGDFCFFFLLS